MAASSVSAGVDERGSKSPDAADAAAQPRSATYAVVHLVAGETTKDLIIPQVVTHMIEQARTDGPLRPMRVCVVLLEPVRVAMRREVRARVREIRRNAAPVKVALVPYVSRYGIRTNAPIVAARIRRLAGVSDVVLHCRGEWATLWAAALSRHFSRAGIVADIRGAWPEEALAKRGFSSLEAADARAARDYHLHLATVQEALGRAGQVLTVSPGMRRWLEGLGVSPSRLHYVPSCVPRLTFSEAARVQLRRELGFDRDLVYAFLGSAESYATIGDGLGLFLGATFRAHPEARLLMVTDRPDVMRHVLQRDGIPLDRACVVRARHEDVWRYLSAADCGCIVKAPGRLNRTWLPVKLGEYLAAGLPVVVSRGVGEVDELVSRAGAGVVIDIFGPGTDAIECEAARVHEALVVDGARMRERALNLCEREFLWSGYIDRVRSAYLQALAT